MRRTLLVAVAAVLQDVVGSAIPQTVLGLGNSCCEPLSNALPGRVFTRHGNTTAYADLNDKRWSNTTILAPSCIVSPQSSQDVARAIKILKCGQCKFAIKSGGHMTNPGANNIDGGISLDLGALDEVTLSSDKSVVRLGAGQNWHNVYDNLNGTGVMVPGGLCGGTGVGGVTLGGGESLFQPRVGWVADNVLNFEVVLASGEIVNANQTSHPKLFKALKGGGPNFGIVTHVDVKTFAFNDFWGGEITMLSNKIVVAETLIATTNFTTLNNANPNSGVQVGIVYLNNGLGFVDVAMAATDGCENPEILQPFQELGPQLSNSLKTRSVSDLISEIELLQPRGYRELVATVTFVNDADTILKVQAANDAVYAAVKDSVGYLDWIMFYVPQPKVMETFSESCTSGGNALGLADLGHDQMVAFIMPRWLDADDDAVMYAASRAWVEGIQDVTRSMGTEDPWLYMNFAAPFQKPLCSYGAENVRFLQEVANTYDPSEVFQRLVPGGFKLSQACGACD